MAWVREAYRIPERRVCRVLRRWLRPAAHRKWTGFRAEEVQIQVWGFRPFPGINLRRAEPRCVLLRNSTPTPKGRFGTSRAFEAILGGLQIPAVLVSS